MASCEKCWAEAGGNAELYQHLIDTEPSCTPEERAGEWAKECSSCGRKTIHQYAKICMNPECDRYGGR